MGKMMTYRIEVNVARKGTKPVWRPLLEEDDTPCEWSNSADALFALSQEGRPEGEARVVPVAARD